MREILFRGKRCDNGEWVQGFYVRADHHWHKNGIHKDWIALGASANGGWFALHNKYAVKAETVGQFTGLTDKNGKMIFEGDIVQYFQRLLGGVDYEHKDPVLFLEGGFTVGVYFLNNWLRDCSNGNIQLEGIEVIGNIHDNPELLENH